MTNPQTNVNDQKDMPDVKASNGMEQTTKAGKISNGGCGCGGSH